MLHRVDSISRYLGISKEDRYLSKGEWGDGGNISAKSSMLEEEEANISNLKVETAFQSRVN